MTSPSALRRCPSCGTRNRVPPHHLAELAARFAIRSIPCFALFAGGREVERRLGVRPAEELVALLRGAAPGGVR